MARTYCMETERILFSTWNENDAPLAQALWGNPLVTRYLTATGAFTDAEIEARMQLEMAQLQEHGAQYYPIFAREQQVFMGCCGLRPYPDDATALELGIHLLPDFWGHGFATEALQRAMAYAFDTLHVAWLFAGHHPENVGSMKTLAKLGFVRTGAVHYAPTGLMHPTYRCNQTAKAAISVKAEETP